MTAIRALTAAFLSFVILVTVSALLTVLPVMWLWNWLMPVLFKLPELGFWQTLGLILLTRGLLEGVKVKISSD